MGKLSTAELDEQLAVVAARRAARKAARRRLLVELDEILAGIASDEAIIDSLLAARAAAAPNP
jgi:hypothetical protein